MHSCVIKHAAFFFQWITVHTLLLCLCPDRNFILTAPHSLWRNMIIEAELESKTCICTYILQAHRQVVTVQHPHL